MYSEQILCQLKENSDKLDKVIRLLEQGGGSSTGTSSFSWCTACASTDNRLIRIRTNNTTGAVSYWEANSATQIVGITAVKCLDDPKTYITFNEVNVVGVNASGTFISPKPTPYSIPGNTVHAISWVVLKGTAQVTVGTTTTTYLSGQGFGMDTNRGYLPQSFSFTGTDDVVISIKTQS